VSETDQGTLWDMAGDAARALYGDDRKRWQRSPLEYPAGLYDGHPPAQRRSATSVAASRSIEPVAGTARANVLAAIRSSVLGLTDEQIQDALAMPASTERPRRVELVELKLVKDSGRTARTRSGRSAVVWIAT